MIETLKLKLIGKLIKSLYKFNGETDDFNKYIQTVKDDIHWIMIDELKDEINKYDETN
tara:strand:+ start:1015 stop:1188 length:174 start_codon:yes stop_codon:yes gene_type:complete